MTFWLAALVLLADSLPPLPSPFDIDVARLPRRPERHERFRTAFLAGTINEINGSGRLALSPVLFEARAGFGSDHGVVYAPNREGDGSIAWLADRALVVTGLGYDGKRMRRDYRVFKPHLAVALPMAGSSLLFDSDFHQGQNDDFEFREGAAAASWFFTRGSTGWTVDLDYRRRTGQAAGYTGKVAYQLSDLDRRRQLRVDGRVAFQLDRLYPALALTGGKGCGRLTAESGTGPVFTSYAEVLGRDLPFRSVTAFPDEERRWFIRGQAVLVAGGHEFSLSPFYTRFGKRRIANPDWTIGYVEDAEVTELTVSICGRQRWTSHRLRVDCEFSRPAAPLSSRYRVSDTLTLELGRGLTARPSWCGEFGRLGLVDSLPDLHLFSIEVSYRTGRAGIVVAARNLLGRTGQYWDDCPLPGRRFGIGGEVAW